MAANGGRGHARLDLDPPKQRLERPHVVEAPEPEDDPAVERDGPARVPRSAAARDQRDVVLVAPRERPSDLLRRGRKDDRVRPAA
jgi:hypothetical protein